VHVTNLSWLWPWPSVVHLAVLVVILWLQQPSFGSSYDVRQLSSEALNNTEINQVSERLLVDLTSPFINLQ